MSLPVDIADAIVTELNAPGSGFDPPLNAQRLYRPEFDLVELKSPRISVVPKAITIDNLGRGMNQHDVSIDVAVQKKVAEGDTADLDGLMALVERIADFFRLRRLAAMPSAIWIKTENVPVYAPDHLETKQVFTSVLTLTFRVVR